MTGMAVSSSIYYSSRRTADEPYKLCMATPGDTHRYTILSGIGGCFHPSISPDGTKLAFVALQYRDIVIHEIQTGELGNLTQTPEQIELNPIWSPSGETIMFQDPAGLWTIRYDGTQRKHIHFPNNFSRVCEPFYAPDNKGFIFC